MEEYHIAPSILAADFGNIQSQVEMLNNSEADSIHIDIMDGVFVPNISFGFSVTQAIKKHTTKPLDFHLMIADPNPYLENCKENGAATISVHYEACTHLHRTIEAIKALGLKAGVALNPHTNVSLLQDVLADIDVVLLMSVNPGFGGQKFIENTYAKIKQLRILAANINPDLLIEIDGGVSLGNALKLKEAGANILVAGNFIFNSPDPVNMIRSLKNV
ncbi:MAG: ribulose-phosphate 3-epimerase [Cyclobacteriaceae bacterium]|jgi:ribulose-phosphate 3-epimerase